MLFVPIGVQEKAELGSTTLLTLVLTLVLVASTVAYF